jgi:hypothetical protein
MNVPMGVEVIRSKNDPTVFWVAVVSSGSPDQFRGCYWHLYNSDSSIESYGWSKGWSGDGWGSAISAMRLAKKAAKRRDVKIKSKL